MSKVSKADVQSAIANLYKANNIFKIKYVEKEFWDVHIAEIKDELNLGKFDLTSMTLSDAMLGKSLLKIKLSNIDLVKVQILTQKLEHELQPHFHKHCTYLVIDSDELLSQIKNWRLEDEVCIIGDINRCFRSARHELLYDVLKKYEVADNLLLLVQSFLSQYETGKKKIANQIEPAISLPVGIKLSYILVNALLMPIDDYFLEELKVPHYARYIDDFYISHAEPEKINSYYEIWKNQLAQLHFKPNQLKSGIFRKSDKVQFLSHDL